MRHGSTYVQMGDLRIHETTSLFYLQMACQRIGRLGQELGPEHRTAVPSRGTVDLDLDALFFSSGCNSSTMVG